MIGVGVGVKHGVHAIDSGAQSLLAEVGTGVDDHDALACGFRFAGILRPAHNNGRAQAAVA
jgi:hypothetical protein